MIVELPIIRRCCCFMPLRRGIIIFGYFNLIITLFLGLLQFLIWLLLYDRLVMEVAIYRGALIDAHFIVVAILYILDAVFNIILIIGTHRKNNELLRVYCYYQISTMVASFFSMMLTYNELHQLLRLFGLFILMSELSLLFVGYVIQIYLLLLIYNQMKKQIYQEGRSHFINQTAQVLVDIR